MPRAKPECQVDVGTRRDPFSEGEVGLVNHGQHDPFDDRGRPWSGGRPPLEAPTWTDRRAVSCVPIETLTGLPAEPAFLCQPGLRRRWLEARLPIETLVQAGRDGQVHVDPDQVHQREGSHR